jgi:hypothetical protein
MGKKGDWADSTAASASAAGTTRRATFLLYLERGVTHFAEVGAFCEAVVSCWIGGGCQGDGFGRDTFRGDEDGCCGVAAIGMWRRGTIRRSPGTGIARASRVPAAKNRQVIERAGQSILQSRETGGLGGGTNGWTSEEGRMDYDL